MKSQRRMQLVCTSCAAVLATFTAAARADSFQPFPDGSVRIQSAVLAAAADVPLSAGTVRDAIGNASSIQVVNFGTTIYTGPIDVTTTLTRVRNNQSVYLKESDDGGFFNFNGNELPNIPRMGMNYYMEIMVWPLMNLSAGTYDTVNTPYNASNTSGRPDSFPGPERLIIGSAGEVYYTGDHYSTNEYVNPVTPMRALTNNSWNAPSGSWNTSSSWAGGHIPVAGEATFLSVQDEATRIVTYDYTGVAVTLGDFLVNADGTSTAHGSMTMQQSGNVLTTQTEEIWARYASAAVVQSGGTDTVTGKLHVGSLVASTGVYNLSGGSLTTASEYIGSTELVAAAGTGSFNQTGGVHTITGAMYLGFAAGGSGNYLLQSGTLNVGTLNLSTGGVFTQTGGTTNISALAATGGAVSVSGGAMNLLAHTGVNTANVASSLTINSAGKLDLSNNALDLSNASLAVNTALIKQGFNNGTWTGTGITSSTASATLLTAVGIIQNNQSGTALYTVARQFEKTTPGIADILIKYTYYGDANLDGKVDASDYSLIDSGYVTHTTGWFNGDFNYDGLINGSDYTLIDNTFNTQGAQLTATVAIPTAIVTTEIADTSTVPEPTIALLGLTASVLLSRRKLRRDNFELGQ